MKDVLNKVSRTVMDYFRSNLHNSLIKINTDLKKISGIDLLITSEEDYKEIKEYSTSLQSLVNEPDRTEYGDFQTSEQLTTEICKLLRGKNANPSTLIEPTFGKGNFILSSIKTFKNLKKIYGIEIFKPYVYETKFKILDYYLTSKKDPISIVLHHANFFDFDLDLFETSTTDNLLIIGNPPWVTNSKLSSLNSDNLPPKSNFKKHNGFLAITGKGDFDIGEFITLSLLRKYSNNNGSFAFLLKNSVIKNLIFDQKRNKFNVGQVEKWQINTLKEFNANTDSSLFFCEFDNKPEIQIDEYDFYSKSFVKTSGWTNSKFVSNLVDYKTNSSFDGISPFEWRSGVKHDCSKVMEFFKKDFQYENKLKQKFEPEEDYIYRILKSSDLNNEKTLVNRYTIVTQRKVAQDTTIIKLNAPKTYAYLESNKEFFERRKSSIYRNKPKFSIFGIGDYSFKPYKVAISSMYKKFKFILVAPDGDKPIMLDDTCYFIGFDDRVFADICVTLLNSSRTQAFISSLAFLDTQRVINKELLNRIDLLTIAETLGKPDNNDTTNENWENFLTLLKSKASGEQITLF